MAIKSELWAVMLNRKAKRQSSQVLDSLGIREGDTIADVGSGGGFFTLEFSRMTGENGRVLAADTNREMLSRIERRCISNGVNNVDTLLCGEDGCHLPEGSCDLVFMRNVFHHIADPITYFKLIRQGLKPEGKVAIIEWLPNDGRDGHPGHCTPEDTIEEVMGKSGFRRTGSYGFLKGQSFNVFVPDFTAESQ